HVRQRHVGDGGVEHLHHRDHHHGKGDGPLPPGTDGAGGSVGHVRASGVRTTVTEWAGNSSSKRPPPSAALRSVTSTRRGSVKLLVAATSGPLTSDSTPLPV